MAIASILNSVKKICMVTDDDTSFDAELIMHTNTVLMALRQMGIGVREYFSIEDATATWDDFLEDSENLEAVKSYVGMRVRMLFDPPSSSLAQAYNEAIKEMEFRLCAEVDPGNMPLT